MEKTILGLYGTANVGKSTTLAALGHLLLAAGATTRNKIDFADYRAVFHYRGIVICLQTYGDFEGVVLEGLAYFEKEPWDILIMASKSRGATSARLSEFARKENARLIWGTPLISEDGKSDISTLKKSGARQLLRLMDEWIDGALL